MTIEDVRPPVRSSGIRMLWLDLTRTCQLACMHCYNDSGVGGTHGTMTREDWIRVIDEADAIGVRRLQLIGGEPTMHPHAADLTEHALALGMSVEVYTNLVHVPGTWWALFQRHGVSIATSYYSDDPAEHNSITGRPSHARTRANIQRCIQLGVPLFVGIVDTGDSRRADSAGRELAGLGVLTDCDPDGMCSPGHPGSGCSPRT